jgi:hypothetical protein
MEQLLKLQKFIAVLLLITVLSSSFGFLLAPKKVEAQGIPILDAVGNALQWVGNAFLGTGTAAQVAETSISIWDRLQKILGAALRVIARRALADMTKSTVNWINTGHFGKPLFLENTGSFFRDVAKLEIKSLIGITGYDESRYPFSKGYWLGVIDRYRQQLAYNSQESLMRITSSDPNLYRTDFGTSGWEGLANITINPQLNALGHYMTADDDIATKLRQANNKINRTLDQGMGFLSPQTCPSNPALNTRNPLTVPVQPFNPSTVQPDTPPPPPGAAYVIWRNAYQTKINNARIAYNAANYCPGGWQTTTPGAVAANEVMEAVNMPSQYAEWSAALGNSLTAIFDALANKFLGGGLTSLASRINSSTPPDTFNYYGVTLDGTTTSPTGWNSSLDEVIDLDTFKKLVSGKTQITDSTGAIVQENIGDTTASSGGTFIPGAIINTALELRLIDDTQPSSINPALRAALDKIRPVTAGQNPGLLQIADRLWPVAFSLDQCIPGPNKDWQERLNEERDRVASRLMHETVSDEQLKVRSANRAIADLRFAVQGFKDWVEIKMFSTIPNGALYSDSINSLEENAQDISQITQKRTDKITAVARLLSIESQLKAITVKPAPGSAQEKQLVKIWQQYNAAAPHIATQTSLESTEAELDLASEKLAELREYENSCMTERVAAGWTLPGGKDGKNPSLVGGTYTEIKIGTPSNSSYPGTTPFRYPIVGTEIEQFCQIPIISGYSHGAAVRADEAMRWVNRQPSYSSSDGSAPETWVRFRNMINDAGLPGYQDLPMTNAQNVYGDQTDKLDIVDVDINCRYIFESDINDYKHAGEELF